MGKSNSYAIRLNCDSDITTIMKIGTSISNKAPVFKRRCHIKTTGLAETHLSAGILLLFAGLRLCPS